MLLTQNNICHYLLESELIRKETVVDGDFITVHIPARNNLYKTISATDKSLFIKQVANFDSLWTTLLKREADAQKFILNDPRYLKLWSSLPGYLHYDNQRHVLVTEYITNSASVHDYYMQNKVFPLHIAKEQAWILASYHFPVEKSKDISAFPQAVPWVLRLDEFAADQLFPNNKTNAELISVVKNHKELSGLLTDLKKGWKQTSLIHGDIKWVNFIIARQGDKDTQYLVDWELADIGDPYWDVAGILQSYIIAWIYSFDNKAPRNNELNDDIKAFDMDKMQPSIQSFWNQYSIHMGLSVEDNKANLIKAIKYAAARVIQTAIEGVVYNPHILPNNMRSIQIAHNILRSPEEAAGTLLGITI